MVHTWLATLVTLGDLGKFLTTIVCKLLNSTVVRFIERNIMHIHKHSVMHSRNYRTKTLA